MSGFIALHREAFDHPLLRDGERFRAWFWMVSKACWKPAKFDIAGKTITLGRGQFCTSRSQLAEAWGWSPSAVERFLTRLETEQMIGRATGQGRSVITISNYDTYQDLESETGQASEQATGQRSDSDRTAKEQGNQETKEPNGSISLKRARAGFRLPADWQPKPLPAEMSRTVAAWPSGAMERELARFRDWAASASGQVALKTDWDAAWRNWLRKCEDEGRYGKSRSPTNRTVPPAADKRDGIARALDRRLGLDDAPGPFGRPADRGAGENCAVIAAPADPVRTAAVRLLPANDARSPAAETG